MSIFVAPIRIGSRIKPISPPVISTKNKTRESIIKWNANVRNTKYIPLTLRAGMPIMRLNITAATPPTKIPMRGDNPICTLRIAVE